VVAAGAFGLVAQFPAPLEWRWRATVQVRHLCP